MKIDKCAQKIHHFFTWNWFLIFNTLKHLGNMMFYTGNVNEIERKSESV